MTLSPGLGGSSAHQTSVELVPLLTGPEGRLKSRMLGNPLVRFWEGQGGNLAEVPCLLDPLKERRPKAHLSRRRRGGQL